MVGMKVPEMQTGDTQKTVLITGAAHRIGRAIALDLAAHGFGVALHYLRSRDKAEELVSTIVNQGGRAVALCADLNDEDALATLIPQTREALGPVSVLVNNASVFESDTVENTTRESWDAHMNVNLRAPFVLSQMFAQQRAEGCAANIINILDQRVWNLTPFFMSYTVSKAGLWTLTQTLALALAPHVRVNGIGPGPTVCNVRQTQDDFRRQWSETPLERRVMPEEIAQAVHFILNAPSMTGQMIALDSGQHMGWGQASNLTSPNE